MADVKTIAVIGAGTMGRGIAHSAALALASFKLAAPHDSRIKPLELRLTTAQVSKRAEIARRMRSAH